MFGRRWKRVIQFVCRPLRPLLRKVVMPINSGVAKGLKGYVGQWTIPMSADSEDNFLRSLRLTGRVIYDVGANIGAMTLFFARAAGDNGRVISFEPNREALGLLRSHITINGFENVGVHGVAVGEVSQSMRLVVPKDRRGSGKLGGYAGSAKSESYRVDVVRLDEYVEAHGLAAPDFVKIDTEGFELACLKGMTGILRASMPTLHLEMHGATQQEKNRNCRDIVCFLHELGYDMYHVESETLVSPRRYEHALRGHLFAYSGHDSGSKCSVPAPMSRRRSATKSGSV